MVTASRTESINYNKCLNSRNIIQYLLQNEQMGSTR